MTHTQTEHTVRWRTFAAVTVSLPGFTTTQPIPGTVTNLGPDAEAAYYALQVARQVAKQHRCPVSIDIHVA